MFDIMLVQLAVIPSLTIIAHVKLVDGRMSVKKGKCLYLNYNIVSLGKKTEKERTFSLSRKSAATLNNVK